MAIDDRSTRHDTYALTVLARNDAGWRNLKGLVSKASLQGYYYVPRIDWATLKEHAEGLIVLSGGLGGVISRTWHGWHGPRSKRRPSSKRFSAQAAAAGSNSLRSLIPVTSISSFGFGAPRGASLQRVFALTRQRAWSAGGGDEQLSLPGPKWRGGASLFDVHQYRTTIDKFDGPEVSGRYLKDDESMRRGWFADHLKPLEASDRVAQRCAVLSMGSASILPPFPCADGRGARRRSAPQARSKAIEKRFAEAPRRRAPTPMTRLCAFERLDHELAIINSRAFRLLLRRSGFHQLGEPLDYASAPGRGSGAGSLVAWALRITDLDPLPYDLLFERFLGKRLDARLRRRLLREQRGEVISTSPKMRR